MSNEMTVAESKTLAKCEKVIEKGIGTFREVGNALLEIRESKLYRKGYVSFADYCDARWGFSDSRARQLIAAAKVAETVEISTVLRESHAKELAKVPEEQRQEVLELAKAKAKGKKLTAETIREAAAAVEDLEGEDLDDALSDIEVDAIANDKPPLASYHTDWLDEATEELREATGNREMVADYLDGLAAMLRESTIAVAAAMLENQAVKIRSA